MAEAIEYLKLDMEDLIELCRDKEFRHSLNGWMIAYQLRNQIRLMRLRKGWTQTELGRRLGMHQATISALENMTPKRFPRIRTLRKIANVFDVALVVRFDSWKSLLDRVFRMQQVGVEIPREFKDDPIFNKEIREANLI